MKRGVVILFTLMMLASCGNQTTAKSTESSCCSTQTKSCESGCCTQTKSCESSTVEVLYMHGKQRCPTCIAIGKEAEATVMALADENVVMKTIDFSTPEGEAIADKYEIASSSLIVVSGGKVENVTAMSFQYARNNPKEFQKNLKATIKKMVK